MSSNVKSLNFRSSLVSTENSLLRGHETAKPWAASSTLPTHPLQNQLLSKPAVNNLNNSVKCGPRPQKRALENLHLNQNSHFSPSKQIHLEINTNLTSVKNNLLENKLRYFNLNLKSSEPRRFSISSETVSVTPELGKVKNEQSKSRTDNTNLLVGEDVPIYTFHSEPFGIDKEVLFGDLDIDLYEETKRLNETRAVCKVQFLTMVCSSLVNSPNFKNEQDFTRQNLVSQAFMIREFDPEFILKAALYARQELNIRSTTNFLLAYAANYPQCRKYLRKYFRKSIRLPSDWMDVAALYQTMEDKDVKRGSVPSMLRKVMVEKFEDFDEYQLAKYNKKKRKKKNKDIEDKANSNEEEEIVNDDDVVLGEDDIVVEKHVFTLKRLIRLLHIEKPHDFVMGLLGKNYPNDPESFRQSGLPGFFEPEKAGKRLKLSVPLTWETQVAKHGNKAEIWQRLIDKKKLPYMAMLRNLRNIILTNVSKKHHEIVLKLISNKTSVVKSRQFPLSFYNAFDTVTELEKLVDKYHERTLECYMPKPKTKAQINETPKGNPGSRSGKRTQGIVNTKSEPKEKKKPKGADIPVRNRILVRKLNKKLPNAARELFPKYKESLEKAIQISVEYNLDPIPGRTLVVCDLLACGTDQADNGIKLVKQNLLLGLMCLSACEDCQLTVNDTMVYKGVDLSEYPSGILEAVNKLSEPFDSKPKNRLSAFYKENQSKLWKPHLDVQAANQQPINTVVFLTSAKNFEKHDAVRENDDFLKKYRRFINPNLLYVYVDLTGQKSPRLESNPLNVKLCGTSDQLLKFLASRGTASQLAHVEQIDKVYNLKPLPKGLLAESLKRSTAGEDKELAKIMPPLEWKTVRVFISSTFKDTHGERDLLVRYVFPELRARARNLLVNVHEVDLRWGITEEECSRDKALELCLSEVTRCHYFLGILGERYGSIPSISALPNEPQFDWVRDYPTGASVTELEIYSAALSCPETAKSKAFFYFRDNSFESDLPPKWYNDFVCENDDSLRKLTSLKKRIKQDGFEVFENYPCHWGKEINNVPVLLNLEEFGQRVLDNMWNAIRYKFDGEVYENNSEVDHKLIGVNTMMEKSVSSLKKTENLIVVHGKSGCGKTAFLRHFVNVMSEKSVVLSCFISPDKWSSSVFDIMLSLCHSACSKLSLSYPIPNDKMKIETIFWDVMSEASKKANHQLIIVIDGIENLKDVENQTLSWLPQNINKLISIVLSVTSGSVSHKTLQARQKHGQPIDFLSMEPMAVAQRKQLVAETLWSHRKTLSNDAFNNQMLLFVTKRDAALPLYLKLACEQLRLFGNFDELTPKIKSLPQSLPQLIQDILHNLENWHGRCLVEAAMILLALSGDGLEEHELRIVVSLYCSFQDKELEFSALIKAIPNANFTGIITPMEHASLCRSIRSISHLNNLQSYKISLCESEIAHAVKTRYLGAGASKKMAYAHKILAGYFVTVADPKSDGSWTGQSSEAVKRVLRHLIEADCRQEFAKIVTTIDFLRAAFRVKEVVSVLSSIPVFTEKETVVAKYSNRNTQKVNVDLDPLKDVYDFCTSNQHLQLKNSVSFIQQAICEPDTSIVFQNAKEKLSKSDSYVFEWLTKPNERSPWKMMISDFPTEIICCCSNLEGNCLALGGSDGVIRLVDAVSGKVIRSLIGHGQGISSLTFLTSNTLCSGSYDNSLSVWDTDGGFRHCILNGHTRRVTCCCSNTTGKTIISVSWDTTIRVWNSRGGGQLSCLENKKPLTTVAYHPTKDIIATGDFDKTVKLWNLEALRRIGVLRGHLASVQCIAFSSNGLNIVSGSLLGEIIIWSTYTGNMLTKSNIQNSAITRVLFNENGSLVSSGWNGSIKVWNGLDETPVWTKPFNESEIITALHFLSREEVVLASSTGSFIIYLIPKRMQICNVNIKDHVTQVTSYKCGGRRWIVVGTKTGNIKYCSKKFKFSTIHVMDSKITSIVSNSVMILVGSASGDICAIDCEKLKVITQIRVHNGLVLSLDMDNGGRFLSGSSDKKLICGKVWKGEFILAKTVQEAHADWINKVAFGNKVVATGSQDTTVKLWHNYTFELEETLQGLGEPVSSLHLTNDFVLACGIKGNLALWNLKGQLMYSKSVGDIEKRNFGFLIEKDDFGGLSGLIAYIGSDNALEIKKLLNLTANYALNGHPSCVTGLTRINRNTLVSTSDKSICWWNTSPNAKKYHKGKIIDVGISKKGYYAFGIDPNCLTVWKLVHNEKTYLEFDAQVNYENACITAATFTNNEGTSLCAATHSYSKENGHMYGVRPYTIADSQLKEGSDYTFLKSEVTSIHWSSNFNIITMALKKGDIIITDSNFDGSRLYKMDYNWVLSGRTVPHANSYQHVFLDCNGTITTFKDNDKHTIISSPNGATITVYDLYDHEILAGDCLGHLHRHILQQSDQEMDTSNGKVHTFSEVVAVGNSRISSCLSEISESSMEVSSGTNDIKMHSGEITGVCRNENVIFTCSTDRTVKAWDLDTLEQIGQYNHGSPITTLRISSIEKGDEVLLLIGTDSGEIHLLRWTNNLRN